MIELNTTIRKVTSGDRKAIEALYKYCFQELMPVAFYYKMDEESGRELFNTSFMKILQKLETFSGDVNKFKSWARRVMANTVLDNLRKSKRMGTLIASDFELENYKNSNVEVNSGLANLEYQELKSLLFKLPETTRQVFILYAIEGFKHKEISLELSIPEGTSKWHVNMARTKLQSMLNTYYKEKVIATI